MGTSYFGECKQHKFSTTHDLWFIINEKGTRRSIEKVKECKNSVALNKFIFYNEKPFELFVWVSLKLAISYLPFFIVFNFNLFAYQIFYFEVFKQLEFKDEKTL